MVVARSRARICRKGTSFHFGREGSLRWLFHAADQFQQMMIFDELDAVGERNEAPVQIVEFAAVILVAELLAASASACRPECLPSTRLGRERPRIAAS